MKKLLLLTMLLVLAPRGMLMADSFKLDAVCKADIIVNLKDNKTSVPTKEESKIKFLKVTNGAVYFNGDMFNSGKEADSVLTNISNRNHGIKVTKQDGVIFVSELPDNRQDMLYVYKCK